MTELGKSATVDSCSRAERIPTSNADPSVKSRSHNVHNVSSDLPDEVRKSRVEFQLDFVSIPDNPNQPYQQRMSQQQQTSELHEYELQDQINFLPIVYSPAYDVRLFGLEKVHPFDTKKWSKIADRVKEFLLTSGGSRYDIKFLSPKRMITSNELQVVHTESFVHRMHTSQRAVAAAVESAFLLLLPMSIIRSRVIEPIKWQVAGSILASKVALDQGYCIHIGGGFHHCSHNKATGFCLFADISLAIQFLWRFVSRDLKFMIIDLDAHQGNGHERDVLMMPKEMQKLVYIMDFFNPQVFPRDNKAKTAINRLVEVRIGTTGPAYLELLEFHINAAFNDFPDPDLVIYNAGTDVLKGDSLGRLNLDFDSVVKRDEIVFQSAIGSHKKKLLMLTSGGYSSRSAELVAASIQNLFLKRLII